MKKITLLLLLTSFCLGASAQRMAVVDFSTSYLRQKPDYESPLETQELMGTVVEIVGEQGYWREVVTPQPYRAWCTDKGLVEMTPEQLQAYKDAPKVMYSGLYGHVYVKKSMKSATVCDLVGGDVLRLVGRKGCWTEVMLPSGKTGYVPSKELKIHDGFISIAQGEGSDESIDDETMEKIISRTEQLLGCPYLWGGMSAKGVDCSGLVRISCIMNGILLPRNASQQINCGDRVELPYDVRFWDEAGRERLREFKLEMLARTYNLKRGDLLFFGTPAATAGAKDRITHVGIYLGDFKMIHSSHCVRVNSLLPDEPDYYENSHRLLGAVRL